MAEDDGSLIIPVSLDTSNVLPSLEKIAQQAGGVTGSQIKKAMEASLSGFDFSKILSGKTGGEQLNFLRSWSKQFQDFSKTSTEASQIASTAYEAFTKKLTKDFSSAGNSKGLSEYVKNQAKTIQSELNKTAITAQLQFKVDKSQEKQLQDYFKAYGRAQSELVKNQEKDLQNYFKTYNRAESQFSKEKLKENKELQNYFRAYDKADAQLNKAQDKELQNYFKAYNRADSQFTRDQLRENKELQNYFNAYNRADAKVTKAQDKELQNYFAAYNKADKIQTEKLNQAAIAKDIANLRNVYGQLNSQYDANGRRLPGIPGPKPNNLPSNAGKEFSSSNLQNALLTIGFSSLAIATTNLANKMVDASASIELAQRRLSTVIKDPRQSEQYFNFLRNYEKTTAYELPDVLEAGTAFATQTRQLGRAGLGKESALRLSGELGSLNPNAGIVEGQRAISRVISGDPNGLEILRSKFAITNEILKEGGARVSDQGVSLQSVKNRRLVIQAIDKFIQETTGGKGAENLNQTLAGRFSTLQSQLFTSMASIMDLLAPKIKMVVNGLIELLQWTESFPNSLKEMIGGGVLLSAGFFSIAASIGGITIVLNGLKTAFLALEAVMLASTAATEGQTIAEGANAAAKGRSILATPVSSLAKAGNGAAIGAAIRGLLSYLGVGAVGLGALGIGAAAGIGVGAYENYQNNQTAKVKKEEIDAFLGYSENKNKRMADGSYQRVAGKGAQYLNNYLENGQADYFESQADNVYRYGSNDDVKNIQAEAKKRKSRLETVLGYEQQRLKETPQGSDAYKFTEGKIKKLEVAIGGLADIADPTTESLKDLGQKIALIQAQSALGNNDPYAQISSIINTDEYNRLKRQADTNSFPDDKSRLDWANIQKTIKDQYDRGNQSRAELNIAQSSVGYAKKGGSSFDQRIGDLQAKQSAITGSSREDDIKRIQIEAQIEEEKFKKAKEFNKNRIDNVRLLKGEEKARVMEINQAEQDHLREIGKNEAQAKLIRAQARQDRLNAHLDMLNKLLDMEQNNIKMALDIERSQRDRGIARTETGKDIASMGDQFLSAKGRLANLSEIIGKENEVLKIKKEQTAEAIKGIKAEASATITKLERELQRGGLSKEEKAKIKDQIELEKRNRDEKVKTANETFGNEEKKSKADQTAKTTKAQQDQDKETIDQKLAILEQRKAELEYVQQKQKNDGSETEFSRQDNLQKSFEIEKKMLELKEQRAEAETPLDDEVSKDNLRRKLRLDILNLQQQYVSKLKEGTGELERQNKILELQKKMQERPAIYGIEDLNQRMKDESELFRLQSGFGQGGNKGKGPYPGYGPKVYNGVDKQPGTFIFGDTSTPVDLQRQTANDVFKSAGEAVSRDAQGRVIKTPINKPSRADIQLPKLILPVSVELGGRTIGKQTKEVDLQEFNNMNPDVKGGGKPAR